MRYLTKNFSASFLVSFLIFVFISDQLRCWNLDKYSEIFENSAFYLFFLGIVGVLIREMLSEGYKQKITKFIKEGLFQKKESFYDKTIGISYVSVFMLIIIVNIMVDTTANESIINEIFELKYDHNIFESEAMEHSVGSVVIDPDASEGKSIMAEKEKYNAGYLLFGPYVTLAPGRYKVSYQMKVDDNTLKRSVAILDVASELGQRVLAKKGIIGNDFKKANVYQPIDLTFNIKKAMPKLEFRIKFLGGVNMWVDYVDVVQRY